MHLNFEIVPSYMRFLTLLTVTSFLIGCSNIFQSGYIYPPNIPSWADYESVRQQFSLPDDINAVGLVVTYSAQYKSFGSICNDGSASSSTGKGTCSWHGGVARTYSTTTGPRYLVKYLLGSDGSCKDQQQFSKDVLGEKNMDFFCKLGHLGEARAYKEDRVPTFELVGWKTYLYEGSEVRVLKYPL
ncbi:hypothetical protein [Vibrio coralliilyticus]|uniref:hypothetical protein n=1 Tax=Vibrio coralliilyticus TaxID=190893 RepID=UPI00148D6642|nr:hypothetical protein [Vibrio coralliilyticus]